MKHIADITTEIAGIPCGIVITHYAIERADDGDFVERDWFVVDRKGYRADWLDAKLTKAQEREINYEIDEVMA